MLRRCHERDLKRGRDGGEDRGDLLPYFLRVLSFQQGNYIENVEKNNALAEAALRRFGLDTYVARRCRGGAGAPPISPSRVQALPGENKNNNKKKKKKSNQNHSTASSVVPISSAWQEKIESSYTACLDDHGYINFDHVFSEGTFGDLKLEICSGAGEWGVSQAQNDERSRYVTLELRHDRVYGTFYRSICAQTSNLCVIGGDAVDVVKRRIKSNCLSNIFINHPEPPQQNNKGQHEPGQASAHHGLPESCCGKVVGRWDDDHRD